MMVLCVQKYNSGELLYIKTQHKSIRAICPHSATLHTETKKKINSSEAYREETGMSEKSSWDQANILQKLGLLWKNRKKISQIIKDYFYLPFFLFIILWWRISTESHKGRIPIGLCGEVQLRK